MTGPRGGAGRAETGGAGRWNARDTSSRGAGLVWLVATGRVEIRGPGEMAETAALVWVRGPGFGCKAVRWGSAPCSVRDFIHRHCHDLVRFAVPGRKGLEADGAGLGAETVGRGRSLWGFQFLRLRVLQF